MILDIFKKIVYFTNKDYKCEEKALNKLKVKKQNNYYNYYKSEV